jgi:hypothetical protein
MFQHRTLDLAALRLGVVPNTPYTLSFSLLPLEAAIKLFLSHFDRQLYECSNTGSLLRKQPMQSTLLKSSLNHPILGINTIYVHALKYYRHSILNIAELAMAMSLFPCHHQNLC